jgi:hypothetical protein
MIVGENNVFSFSVSVGAREREDGFPRDFYVITIRYRMRNMSSISKGVIKCLLFMFMWM